MISERPFGRVGETAGKCFTISAGDISVEVIEYGARLRSCRVPDVNGKIADIVPGFDSEADYRERGGSMGAICGRYGNRIAFGQFELEGETFQLSLNDPPHSLHGGFNHFGRHLWTGTALPDQNAVRFTHFSPDGDEGWPGNLQVETVYRLTDEPRLTIEMSATTDRPTYVNLLFHGYWNLAGHASGSIDDHLLQVMAQGYLPKSALNLPTGEIAKVAGTPFDFRSLKPIGHDIPALGGRGYDHNLCLDHPSGLPDMRLLDPGSGRSILLTTDQPGVQLFTANNWSNLEGKDGAVYQARSAIALESQAYPNTPNTPAFAPVPLRPGETYRHVLSVRFEALDPLVRPPG